MGPRAAESHESGWPRSLRRSPCSFVVPSPSEAQGEAGGRQASPAEVRADPRIELFAIMWRLAGSHVFGQGGLEPYVEEAERHFGPHRGHPALTRARDLLEMGIDFSAVMSLAVHMTDPYTLRVKVPFDAPGGLLDRYRMPAPRRAEFLEKVPAFLEEARRFATDARAREFFGAHRALYDSAGIRLRRVVEEHVDLGWFERFFGVPPGGDVVVIPLLAASQVNFGPQLTGAGVRPARYAILGVRGVDSLGLPRYEAGMVRTLVHEIDHSFVNDLLASYEERFSESGPAVFDAVAEAMRPQGYREWRVVLAEALVDAAKTRYILAHEGAEAAAREVERLKREGHVYMGELFDLLGAYESDRDAYPTLDSFMPRIVEYYESLPARIEELTSG